MQNFNHPRPGPLGKEYKIPLGYNALADRESWAELGKFLESIFRK